MDLAKIRKKSLLTIKESGEERLATPEFTLKRVNNELANVPATPVSSAFDSFPKESCFTQVSPSVLAQPVPVITPECAATKCTPLEAILAGRSAAGCDEESILADDGVSEIIVESALEILCFRVANEIYGINIMDIKEIIKPREVTEVPRAPLFVSGVLSLRGTIIPVIDMRIRLGLAHEENNGKKRIVVIKNNGSFSGLLVDEVTQVAKVPLDAVESAPAVLDGVDRDFISGLGRSDGRLIIILNLDNIANINLY